MSTVKVVETLRSLVREGVPWREPRATTGRACGSTLRRRLDEWSTTAVLRRVHVAPVRMVRAGPEAAPRDLVVSTDGIPPGVVPSASNVHDTHLVGRRPRLGQVARAAIGRPYADAACDSAGNRGLCFQDGIQPRIRRPGELHGSVRCMVEHDGAWLLANKRLDRRQDRLGRVMLALVSAACVFLVASRISPFRKPCPKRWVFRFQSGACGLNLPPP